MSFWKKIFNKKETAEKWTIAAFWSWFATQEKKFAEAVRSRSTVEPQFLNPCGKQLARLRDGILLLVGMKDGDVDLIFTADGAVKNFALVEELVAAAPAIPGWQFQALKPALPIEQFGIKMGGIDFDRNTLQFHAVEHPRYPDLIDLRIVHSAFGKHEENAVVNGCFIFLENYLGESRFATAIDNVEVVGPSQATAPLNPMEKLPSYLAWREKEFIEKYDGQTRDTSDDAYSLIEIDTKDGGFVAAMNTDLLQWDGCASHPWMVNVVFKYSKGTNGMPDPASSQRMAEVEEQVDGALRDVDGYLNVGRITGGDERTVFIACKEFRKPSRLLATLAGDLGGGVTMEFEIFKDKYWRSLDPFRQA